MALDVADLRSFYGTPLGLVARRLLVRDVRRLWPRTAGCALVGIGYATPILEAFRGESGCVLALMPAAQGVVNWPAEARSATALVDPYEIPLPNASVDRVLLVHILETVTHPGDLLSEVWRVLTPGGRVIAVVPNRRGLWARMDTTPFGHGQPFSRGQVAGLMRAALFSPEAWVEALFVPPLERRFLLRWAGAWETTGSRLGLPFAGVHIVDATKQLYRPARLRAVRRGFVMAVPQPARAA